MEILAAIEARQKIILPKIYKDFFLHCNNTVPPNLTGTDIPNNYHDLNTKAIELLTEDGVENFLTADDFVFMMHQGYMFWYFKADGNPDPMVYGYQEQKLIPDTMTQLSKFLQEYL